MPARPRPCQRRCFERHRGKARVDLSGGAQCRRTTRNINTHRTKNETFGKRLSTRRSRDPFPQVIRRLRIRIQTTMRHSSVSHQRTGNTGRVRSALGRAGRWTLVAIVLVLALIGFLHLTRGTAVRHVRGVSSDGIPIAVARAIRDCGTTAVGDAVDHAPADTGARAGWPTRSADPASSELKAGCASSFFTMPSAPWTSPPAIATRSGPVVASYVEPFRPIRISTLHLAQHRSHVRGIVIDSRVGSRPGFPQRSRWAWLRERAANVVIRLL